MLDHKMLFEIRDTIQDCNINFLVGSGMSSPYLELLGNIEVLLSSLSKANIADDKREIAEVSLYKFYFDGVISKNIDILESKEDSFAVLNNYKRFLQVINSLLLSRRSTILSKQINIFTTNIDVFLEKALDSMGLEYNDGFSGRFSPMFSLSNFKKSFFRRSLHYENTSEIPVFNMLKLHGSLTWKEGDSAKICFSRDLETVRSIKGISLPDSCTVKVDKNTTIENLVSEAKTKTSDTASKKFLDEYRKLLIINPTKEKFRDTVFNQAYYDLLRMYSNELEKENTVMFVMGFSFEDEHIRELTLRVANANPTLIIYIISYTPKENVVYENKLDLLSLKNSNIKLISPDRVKNSDDGSSDVDENKFDFQQINERIFDEILKKVDGLDDD